MFALMTFFAFIDQYKYRHFWLYFVMFVFFATGHRRVYTLPLIHIILQLLATFYYVKFYEDCVNSGILFATILTKKSVKTHSTQHGVITLLLR